MVKEKSSENKVLVRVKHQPDVHLRLKLQGQPNLGLCGTAFSGTNINSRRLKPYTPSWLKEDTSFCKSFNNLQTLGSIYELEKVEKTFDTKEIKRHIESQSLPEQQGPYRLVKPRNSILSYNNCELKSESCETTVLTPAENNHYVKLPRIDITSARLENSEVVNSDNSLSSSISSRQSPQPIEYFTFTQSKPLHKPFALTVVPPPHATLSPSSFSDQVRTARDFHSPTPRWNSSRELNDSKWANAEIIDNLYEEFMFLNQETKKELMRLDLSGTPSPEPFTTLPNGKRIRLTTGIESDAYDRSNSANYYSPALSTIAELQSGASTPCGNTTVVTLNNDDLFQSYSTLPNIRSKSWTN